VTTREHGAGVVELIDRLLADEVRGDALRPAASSSEVAEPPERDRTLSDR
jgi:hypothetical protein